MDTTSQPPLELWGGVECTINRVGDRYFSQLARNDHRPRLDDLDRFAELGIRRLRFPVLWEELDDDSLGSTAWTQIDAQLQRLRELEIEPIVGLLHHGSGPRYTSLVDPEFPQKLAQFAGRVAQRYPWIDAYTPVNEPLTTARFSALYGHWYPHAHDGATCARALLNQLRGVVLAMRAIREINPQAALVQTDDLGKIFSAPKLQYQADFENERRWLSWDLLCGRVDREHPMWGHFRWLGLEERDIAIFSEELCPPQIIGVNHYITSERYLDENLRAYPPETHGGNGRDRYVDVAAVRVRPEGVAGPETLLREACARYNVPVAVTEAHLGCTRDEQLRWLKEVWDSAQTLRREGHRVCAVTAWSLLGAYDWDSLLTREQGHYEPGAFDVRSGARRATAVAEMVGAFGRDAAFDHPVLDAPGWWKRPARLSCNSLHSFTGRRNILITGGDGRLGRAFNWAADVRALSCRSFTRRQLNITDEGAIAAAFAAVTPWAVINCAGFSSVDAAERDEQSCFRANVDGAKLLAQTCAQRGIPLLTFSSDFVFNGEKAEPYIESDAVDPLNVYGESKAIAETKGHDALIIRCGKIFAPLEPGDFLRESLESLARGERVLAPNDTTVSPTHLLDLVNAALDLLIDDERGVWHLANAGACTPAQLLVRAAELAQLDAGLIEGVPAWSFNRPARRPRNRALASERGQLLPPLENALERFVRDVKPLLAHAAQRVAAR